LLKRNHVWELKGRRSRERTPARVRVLAAYEDFRPLWKDADPGIPILIVAKSEYARLK
jgi:hypothetical protein